MEKDKNITPENEEKKSEKLKKPSKKEVIGGYTRKQYEDALRELDPEEKNAISHRGKALRALKEYLG